jgi:3D (Asp-Asp-Asp) domain-containing protein
MLLPFLLLGSFKHTIYLLIIKKLIMKTFLLFMTMSVFSNNNFIENITLTTYRPSIKETDANPDVTASGFKIDLKTPEKHKILAVSRDLKKKFKWGSKVRITNAGRFNGVYRVHDVMNKRYKKRIDVLIGWKQKATKLNNVKIIRL